MQHDDSYCLNHLFFDDWFVSSIAPDMKDWTKSERARPANPFTRTFWPIPKNPETGAPLPNRMFRPTPEACSRIRRRPMRAT